MMYVLAAIIVLMVIVAFVRFGMNSLTPDEVCDECDDALNCEHYTEGGKCWYADPDNLEVDD